MREKMVPALLCLVMIFGCAGCKAQEPLISDETKSMPADLNADVTVYDETETDQTAESTVLPAEKGPNNETTVEPSPSRPAAPSPPANSEPAKPPSPSSASDTAASSSTGQANPGTSAPPAKTYRSEDFGMTYAQMEDKFRSYAESRGLVYDASLTVENAGFTGRVTSFGETWESFYQAVVRWMEVDVGMYSPQAVRVQLVRSEDDTFEYAYVLWM